MASIVTPSTESFVESGAAGTISFIKVGICTRKFNDFLLSVVVAHAAN
jgi:hypothetical protein